MLIIGANPRWEASVLNARIRKRWRIGNLPVGVIGDVGDLRYDYEQLGAGADTLKELADGGGKFFSVLKKATRPLIIVGQGALARADGKAVLGLAAKLARRSRRSDGRLERLCRAAYGRGARRRPRYRLRAGQGRQGRRRNARIVGRAVPARRRRTRPEEVGRDLHRLYRLAWRCRRASRRRVLPGAAYTEKSGTYVNTEGRVQQTNRAGFAPGEAKENWAILRALSDVLGHRLPFDSLAQLRTRLHAEIPHFGARPHRPGGCRRHFGGCANSADASARRRSSRR